MLVLIVVGMALQALNSLRWQLSLLVGPGLGDLLLLLLAVGLVVGLAPLVWPWIQAWRRRSPSRTRRSATRPG